MHMLTSICPSEFESEKVACASLCPCLKEPYPLMKGSLFERALSLNEGSLFEGALSLNEGCLFEGALSLNEGSLFERALSQ